jgi:hypothetical protein
MEYWPDGFPKMHTVFPDGAEHGSAKVIHRTPTEEEAAFARIRMIGRGPRGGVQAGETIAQLKVNGRLWMSDTRDERRDHWGPRHHAQGHVLIAGLGFGMVALAAALKPEVEKVTVIEINPDVIGLTVPYLRAALEAEGIDPDKIEVIEADIFEWKPPKGQLYQCIWFDIWATICTDNLPEYQKLNRRFARRTDGYRGAWVEEELKYKKRQENREERRWRMYWG